MAPTAVANPVPIATLRPVDIFFLIAMTHPLVRRFREDAPLNELRIDKLYGGGVEGYVDYPFLAG